MLAFFQFFRILAPILMSLHSFPIHLNDISFFFYLETTSSLTIVNVACSFEKDLLIIVMDGVGKFFLLMYMG